MRAQSMIRVVVLLLPIVIASREVRADPDPVEDDGEIDDTLCADAERADTWNTAWGITFAAAAIGAVGVAALAPDEAISDDTRVGLYITASKAALGAVVRVVKPLHLDVERPCHDRDVAPAGVRRALLASAARRERNALLLNTVGGLAVNVGGLLYLGYGRDAWRTAWISFGVGTAVGLASTLTAPHGALRLHRRLGRIQSMAAVPIISKDQGGVALVGTW